MAMRSSNLQMDIKQAKSLLTDFKKAKMKCLELSDQLGREVENLDQYQILAMTCSRKLESADFIGVQKIKRELVNAITKIFETQRELMFELENSKMKKIEKKPLLAMAGDSAIYSYDSQQVGVFEVPNYQSRQENNHKKIERIANYILDLGKSMVALRKGMTGEWSEDDLYKYEPEYLEMVRKLEQFKMRDEELGHIIEKRFEEQLHSIIAQGEKVEDHSDHFIVKINKKTVENFGKTEEQPKKSRHDRSFDSFDTTYHPVSMIEPKRKIVSSKKLPLEKINEQRGNESEKLDLVKHSSDNTLDLHSMSVMQRPHNISHNSRMSHRLGDSQYDDEDKNDNYVYMVKKISPDSQLNSSIISSISSLRSLRKKVFDDDIWDEFEKI